MTKPKPRPAPQDTEIFRRAVHDATPLPSPDRVQHPRSKPKPRRIEHDPAVHDHLSDHIPFDPQRVSGEPLSFARPGLQKQVIRELRRGRGVEAELDLHGLTVPDARRLLAQFLLEAKDRGLRRVLVIHGKGARSEGGEGVLKGSVSSWLAQWADVLAFNEAPLAKGGSGAVVVLLRASR
ncbi:MAG TPA: Smr/MutS family protein [Burkholderiales bacterium]|nr:Smr/MutS family protein [Burkholderiales bacterium]